MDRPRTGWQRRRDGRRRGSPRVIALRPAARAPARWLVAGSCWLSNIRRPATARRRPSRPWLPATLGACPRRIEGGVLALSHVPGAGCRTMPVGLLSHGLPGC